MAVKAEVRTGKIEEFYCWKELALCDMVQEWDDETFYVEWSYQDSMKKKNTMLIGLDGVVKTTNVFMVESDLIEWPEYIDDDGIYREDDILTLQKFLEKRVCSKDHSSSAEFCQSIGREIYLNGIQEAELICSSFSSKKGSLISSSLILIFLSFYLSQLL